MRHETELRQTSEPARPLDRPRQQIDGRRFPWAALAARVSPGTVITVPRPVPADNGARQCRAL